MLAFRMGIILRLIVNAIVILILSVIMPGVSISGFGTALIVAIVLGLINSFLKPVLILLTLSINILTLGLFTLVINALLILLVSSIVPGFNVSGFGWALLFGIVLSIISSALP